MSLKESECCPAHQEVTTREHKRPIVGFRATTLRLEISSASEMNGSSQLLEALKLGKRSQLAIFGMRRRTLHLIYREHVFERRSS